MKKLIEFYPCPGCSKNIFEFWLKIEETETRRKPYLKLRSNLGVRNCYDLISSKKVRFLCLRCEKPVFYEKCPEGSLNIFFRQKIKDFILEHPEKINEKFKEIWKKFLKQEIKSRLNNIFS